MKIAAFWDKSPCSLVEVDRHLRGASSLIRVIIIIVLMVEAGNEVAPEQVFLRVLRFSPANHYITIAPYSSITAP
jgi:hypothetical protein